MRALVVLALAIATPARADDGLREQMLDYFHGEERGGFVLGGMAAVELATGGLAYAEGSDFARGAAYPLLGFSLVHAAAGVFVYLASARRIDKFTDQIARDPEGFRTAEAKRMRGVSRQFFALKVVWVVLIAGGLTMAAIGSQQDKGGVTGAGLAITAGAAGTLTFDIFAARRAHRYRARLAPH